MSLIADPRRDLVLLFNLLQDVAILRGLAELAQAEIPEARLTFFVSAAFTKRDRLGVWHPELRALAEDLGADLIPFANTGTVIAHLEGRSGVMLAASESHLDAHAETRDVFRAAPPGFLTITLQHGLECIGFRQSREHILAHGLGITFAADLICAWLPEDRLTALTASERPKLRVTGPSTVLNRLPQQPGRPAADQDPAEGGLVCENLHSVRLHASGNHRGAFMEIFREFCDGLAARGEEVTLRPHPGGQYVLKTNAVLPENVRLNTRPIYRVDLARYAFGISAPSTIVLDMVLAGLPTAVWCDPDGVMDASAYDGLAMVSTVEDWLGFLRDVDLRRDAVLARQEVFLKRLGLERDPEVIRQRFLTLLRAGLKGQAPPLRPAPEALSVPPPPPARRVLVLTEPGGALPPLPGASVTVTHLTDTRVRTGAEIRWAPAAATSWLAKEIARAAPDLIVVAGWRGAGLRQIAGPGPVLVLADPSFIARLDRGHPKRSEMQLLAAADLIHAAAPADPVRLAREGCRATILQGPLSAVLAQLVAQPPVKGARADA